MPIHSGGRLRPVLVLLLAAFALLVIIVLATGPRAPILLGPASRETFRGAFHIHTTQSDGALHRTDVAAAAARAGLQFAIFTDHGDGTRAPAPPAYIHGVLCIDAVEISTTDGHYIALGLPAAPYPLAGTAAAVAEDVSRLGGFGVAAHPLSPRDELAWSDWEVPLDGLEWLNADSEWRDEGGLRLFRALLDYTWRPTGALASLLDRPDAALARWDRLTERRQVVGLVGHDAHGGFGAETGEPGARGRRLHVPSYEASFRTFSLYVALAAPVSGDPAADADLLLEAIRHGRVFTAIDAVATPASLAFQGSVNGISVTPGGRLPPGKTPARFTVRSHVPPGASTRLLRNGLVVSRADGGVLDHEDAAPGAYRVEIALTGAPGQPAVPWVLSNPIYRFAAGDPVDVPKEEGERGPDGASVAVADWGVEAGAGSSGAIVKASEGVSLQFRLESEPPASQFVALAAPLGEVPEAVRRISFQGRADRPMRLSVQLRFKTAGQRWGRSVYLDQEVRQIHVPITGLRPTGVKAPLPSVVDATSLLFVVDLTNSRPGEVGQFTVWNVRLEAAELPSR